MIVNLKDKVIQIVEKTCLLSYDQGFCQTCMNIIDTQVRKVVRRYVLLTTPIDEKKVLFLSFSGNYDCNPKAICQELIDEGVDANLVWAIYKKTKIFVEFPKNLNFTVRETYDCMRQLASAKVIVDNGISTAWMFYEKRPEQYLIETWHGSIGIKKFGRDSNKDMRWLGLAEKEGNMTDFIISNSDFEDNVYREDFWKQTEIWKFGHPRNDILFCDEEKAKEIKKKIYDKYDIPEKAHVCMYAPTFRDDGDLSPYQIDYDRLSATLSTRFGGEWIIATRFHSRTKKYLKGYKYPANVINVTNYVDIQELMVAIDAGITDYSSWICEYMLTRKPGFTFATDVNDYLETNRSFFIPLSEYPFPTATNEEELFKNILEFDAGKYKSDVDEFLKKNGSIDDGHASERVAAKIKELINA